MKRALSMAVWAAALAAPVVAHADAPRDFIAEAKELSIAGACADGTPSQVKAEVVKSHCKKVKAAQSDYQSRWLAKANPFFAAHVPAGVGKTVVYPFGGGDLATALSVFPDADEITTLSLEPAGDARAIGKLSDKQIKSALGVVATDLEKLYRATFSRTMDMQDGMRGGELPTQLVFMMSALALQGYEPVALRYFTLTDAGEIRYLTDADLARIDGMKDFVKRNVELGSVELVYRKIGSKREQIYRHVMANLDDPHLKTSPAALRHLEKKGHVTAMTKAASFLLTFDEFSTMRKYIIEHVDWMISDATGLAPRWGKPAGFEYETYGTFERSEMDVGIGISPSWVAEYKAQPARKLDFRFGYPDVNYHHNLVIMRRAPKAASR